MNVGYDSHYQTENLFGEPYPELIAFYRSLGTRGRLLDVGCGQGRDAIALARLGFTVTGIDHSAVGITQMNKVAQADNLPLRGVVHDIHEFTGYGSYDFVLLDSMFHFGKKDKDKEITLLRNIIEAVPSGALITVCLQNAGNKVSIFRDVLATELALTTVAETALVYEYNDPASHHQSRTKYLMVTIIKGST